MQEICVENRTQISKGGKTVLYEKCYRGVLLENGSIKLRAYCAKRIPLNAVNTEASNGVQGATSGIKKQVV